MIIGLTGAVLLIGVWLFETFESVRRHKVLIDLKFAVVYLVANILLTIYSYQIGSNIFFYLQICLIVIVLFEIFYTIGIKKVHRR